GLGGPRWRGGVGRPLGPGRNRAPFCSLAPISSRRVRPPGVAPPADTSPGSARTATATWAGDPGPESGGVVPRANEVVAGAVDLCPGGRRGADEQWGGADVTPHR